MLLNTFSRNKRQKNVKNQDGGLKVPLFDLKPSECHVRCQNLIIGTYASTHSTFNLIGPCNKHPNIQSHKGTNIHMLKPLTHELFFQNSSKSNRLMKQNNSFAQASCFFVHFFAITADCDLKISSFMFYGGQ